MQPCAKNRDLATGNDPANSPFTLQLLLGIVAKGSVAIFFATGINATGLWQNVVWHFILPQPELPQVRH